LIFLFSIDYNRGQMACRVVRNQHGTLALSVHWKGRRSWEGTGLADTKANRGQLQRLADLISAELRAGQFTPDRYLHYFPNGNRAGDFRPMSPPSPTPTLPTLGEYFTLWIARQQPPLVRASTARDYRLHLRKYVLPAMIDVVGGQRRELRTLPVSELRPPHLYQLRTRLMEGLGLKTKTARNIMDGSFRAMVRDARTVDQLITVDPFAALRWPRNIPSKPDPFTTEERDAIVAWFRERRPFYCPFIVTLFHTGMRPSEAVALRWGDIDTTIGTITISRSRYMGSEAAPKTRGSHRTIRLLPEARETLRDLKPLHADADDYVFTNGKNGGPLDQREWPKDHWRTVLRSLGIRPRKFYATRHTFISVALTNGTNVKFLAEYCGTSMAMIEQNYGRFLESEVDAQLQLMAGANATTDRARKAAGRWGKPSTLSPGLTVRAEKPLENKASPTGFEPVLPA